MKHEIIIYTDARGRAPLREYLKELKSQKAMIRVFVSARFRIISICFRIKELRCQNQYVSIFQIESIPGYGNYVRAAIVYYSLPGMVARLFFFMLLESRVRKHLKQNYGKLNVSIRTGWKGMVKYEQKEHDLE